MATTTELVLAGNLEQARAIADSVLASEGFTVGYSDPWNGTAERGSKVATALVGAWTGKKHQHIKIGVAYRSLNAAQSVLILSKLTSGVSAGAIGVARAKRAYEEAVTGIRGALATSGQLVG